MAEIFGVIAGGIGAGSFAIQLIDKAGKLSTILKSIKDAPKEIHEMLVEIELLTEILNEIEDLRKREPQIMVLTKSSRTFKLCQAATDELRSLVEDLDACYNTIGHAYSWKSVRAYMKKDKVKVMTARAKRAFELLMMVNQLLFHSSQSRKLDLILDSARPSSDMALIPAKSVTKSNSCVLTAAPWRFSDSETSTIKWHSITSYWILIGNIHVCNGTLGRRQKRKTPASGVEAESEIASWKFQFHPAIWTSQKGFAISGCRPFGNWQYTMTQYNLRPADAPIFIACENRELDTVRKLLDEGLASPFDVSPKGETPLHIAAATAATKICQLLIERGADGNYVGVPGDPTPLMCLAEATEPEIEFNKSSKPYQVQIVSGRLITNSTSQEIHDTVRLLVEKGKCDPMIGRTDASRNSSSALTVWGGSSESFKWLLEQEHFEVDLDAPNRARGKSTYHELAFSLHPQGSSLISDVLWTDTHISRMTTDRDDSGRTVLHVALVSLAFDFFMMVGMLDSNKSPRFEVIRRLLQANSDIHARNDHGKTPLTYLIKRMCRSQCAAFDFCFGGFDRENFDSNMSLYEKKRRILIRHWLVLVAEAGYDLNEYVRKEESLQTGEVIEEPYEFETGEILESSCRVVYIYGNAQGDVDISCEFKFEERARSEPMEMPGRWIEDTP